MHTLFINLWWLIIFLCVGPGIITVITEALVKKFLLSLRQFFSSESIFGLLFMALAFFLLLVASTANRRDWRTEPFKHLIDKWVSWVLRYPVEIIIESIWGLFLRIHDILQCLILVITQQKRNIVIKVELMQSPQCVLWDNILLILTVANVVSCVRKKIDKSIGDEANEVHCFFLSSHILRQGLFDNFV